MCITLYEVCANKDIDIPQKGMVRGWRSCS